MFRRKKNNEDTHQEVVCPACNTKIAPYDLNRQLWRGAIWHSYCRAQQELRDGLQRAMDRARRRRAS